MTVVATIDKNESLTIEDSIFEKEYNPTLVHYVIDAYIYNGKQRTKKLLSRGEVKATSKKMHRQKGTGKARRGNATSNILRGGGVAFAHDFVIRKKKVNKKVYRRGVAMILSELLRTNRLSFLSSVDIDGDKTKDCAKFATDLGINKHSVIISPANEVLEKTAKNIRHISLMSPRKLDLPLLLKAKNTYISKEGLAIIEELIKL